MVSALAAELKPNAAASSAPARCACDLRKRFLNICFLRSISYVSACRRLRRGGSRPRAEQPIEARTILALERTDLGLILKREADFIKALHQAALAEGVDLDRVRCTEGI